MYYVDIYDCVAIMVTGMMHGGSIAVTAYIIGRIVGMLWWIVGGGDNDG